MNNTPSSNSKLQPIPTVKGQLKDLILTALDTPYISHSSKDEIETGNRYQSVRLGETQTKGGRTDRAAFLDQIDFAGAKVLDLGSNLGEMSRSARARGAELVDGFEYDPFFIETARLINDYNEISRVSFYQRDITDPSIYRERYDIVMVLSTWVYAQSVLTQIAEITKDVLVLETHRLEDNLETTYLKPLLAWFPYYRLLGTSEWLTNDPKERRALVVLAKTEEALARRLKNQASQVESFPSPFDIDVRRTVRWCDTFFSMFTVESAEELLATIGGMEFDLDKLAKLAELRDGALGSWAYWALYIRGYLQFAQTGQVESGNIYFDYLTKYFGPQGHDPVLRALLADPKVAAERVRRRFQDFDLFRGAAGTGDLTGVTPVQAVVRRPPTVDAKPVFWHGSSEYLNASIDGYHRLFLARLFGLEKLRGEVVNSLNVRTGTKVAVISKGDESLLNIDNCQGWHFPQTDDGVYSDHLPVDSRQAIDHLEVLRGKGAQYLLFPSSEFWWFEHYPEFRQHLNGSYPRIYNNLDAVVYELSKTNSTR